VVVTALLGSLLVAPGVAHASASAETSPTVAFRAGESSEPVVARASVVLPDGDVVQGGDLAAAATFGDVVLDPEAGSQPSFLARLSPDRTAVRWAHDLGGPGHLSGLARSGTALVGLRSTFSGGAGTATGAVTSWDAGTGQPLWENDLGLAPMLVEPDLAVAPDGTVLVAGTYRGSLALPDGVMHAPDAGAGFLLALDPATGQPLWGRTFASSQWVALQSVAVAPGGAIFLGGLFTGALDDGVRTWTATSPSYGSGVVLALASDGSTSWTHLYDAAGNWPQFDNLVATDTQVFARTMAAVLPGWTRPTLSALSAADGTGRWSVGLPSTTYESRTAPLALLGDGTLVAGLTFSSSVSIGRTTLSTSDGQKDVALLGVEAASGAERFVRQLGAAGDDRLVDATTRAGDLVLSGDVTTPTAVGVVEHATYVGMPASQRLSISVADTGAARSDVPFSVVAEPSSPTAVVVSGPCHLVSYAEGQGRVHLDHVGDCQITASTSALKVVDHLQVVPLVPTLRSGTRAVTWPEPVPADPGYVFEDADGTQVAGTVTTDLPAGQVLDAGTYPVDVSFHSSDPDVSDAAGHGTFLVARADAHVAFAAPRTLAYGATWSPQVTATGVDGNPLSGQLLSSPIAPGTTPDAGEYDVSMRFQPDNPNYRVVWDFRKLTVTKAATRLEARFAKLKQQLTATLTDVSNAVPLAGRTVTFYFGSRTCTAVTDATGNAVCALSALDTATAARTGVNAVYTGDRNHAAAAVTIPAAL
jgi:outer membrane protein assembly factor BamB